jgi:hypothetical protein
MRREPSLTLEGALKILGHYEPKWIEKLNNVLGGVALGAGAAGGLAAVGPAVLAPLAMFGAVWGWIGNKDIAIGLLKQAVGAVSGKLDGTAGFERRQLIGAAHTTIVVAAFFEVLEEEVGAKTFGRLRITDSEKAALVTRQKDTTSRTIYELLYKCEIPAPSAVRGFEDNIRELSSWFTEFAADFATFTQAVGDKLDIRWPHVIRNASERYRSHFLALAATVPEFMIWAMLSEHGATRAAVTTSQADIAASLDGTRDALSRVEALLTLGAGPAAGALPTLAVADLRWRVALANRGILDQKILPEDTRSYGPDIAFPTVVESYINPRYRIGADASRMLSLAREAPEEKERQENPQTRDDFDLMLAAYVTSPDATRQPMLLLGHPGAGKSILTKVLAARLPASVYTTVRVPLRQTGANARVINQIEDALYRNTNWRIEWGALAEQGRETVRVVLLDGLDELLQASEHDRSGYLLDVMEFQQREVEQERPVIVIVTSRTVVADRVRIPDGTTIVNIEPFSEGDIADWLGRWRRVNENAITAGMIGELTADAALSRRALAEQPLLLLMLALYAADRTLPPLGEDIATVELYRRLVDGFARREAAKELGLGHDPRPQELKQRVRDHLDRLEIAALAMFNRGRQDIDEENLGKDLESLDPRLMERSRPVEAGRRVIGEFFFIHAPEARIFTGGGTQSAADSPRGQRQETRRAYEFLHATFGEYLVARRVIDELVDVTMKTFAGHRGTAVPEDDLLFALLSHQVLAARKSMLDFAQEIFSGLDDEVRAQALQVLEVLARTYRNRHGSDRYAAYLPVPPDQVRQLACYSANLLALRVLLEPDPYSPGIPLAELLGVPVPSRGALEEWRVTPLLWKAGLDTDGLRAMLTLLEMTGAPPRLAASKRDLSLMPFELSLARLIGDEATEMRLRYGTAIHDEVTYYYDFQSWADMMSSWLIPAIAGISGVPETLPAPPPRTPDKDIAKIAEFIFEYLRASSRERTARGKMLHHHDPEPIRVLQLLFKMPTVFEMDKLALTAAVLGRPSIRERVPELQNFELYGHYAEIVRRADIRYLDSDNDATDWKDPSNDVTYAVEDVLTGRLPEVLRDSGTDG